MGDNPSVALCLRVSVVGFRYCQNGPALVKEIGGWTRKTVWDTLSHIIMEQTAVREDQIVPEASFVQDLGLD